MSETEAETEMVTTERVLAAIAAERDAWRALVAEVGEDRMEEPGPMGEWSFKDLASHLTGWRTHALDRLEAAARGDAPPPTAWPPALRTDDEINAWLHDRDRARPLADVLAEAEATFDRVRSAVGGLSDREANDRARFPMLEGQSLAGAIVSGDFFGHLHEEHEPAVRAWLRDRAGRPGAAR